MYNMVISSSIAI